MMTGWTTKPISEVVVRSGTIDPRKTPEEPFKYVDVSSINNQTFEIVEATEMLGKYAPSRARRHIQAGDVLFATIRPTLRRIAVVPEELDGQVCSTGYFVFRTKPEVDGRYLFYYLFSDAFMGAMETLQSGASYPAVNDSQVRQQLVSFPSLPEQKRIVAILDEAFAGIDAAVANTEKNLANARELFESYLNAVFTQKGDGWVEKPLSSFMDISHGFAFKGPDFKASSDESKPIVLTPGNYSEHGGLYFTEKNTKRFTGELPEKYLFELGELTVVMTDLSSKMKILGKPAFINQPNILHNQRIGRVIFKNTEVSPRLIYYYLCCQIASEHIKKTSTGTMVRHTAPKRILTLNMAFPYSEEGQTKIVSVLDDLAAEVKNLEVIYQQKLNALAELKQSILQKAFAGELTTLPQKPLEEAIA